MKIRRVGRVLPGLILIGLLLTGVAETVETPSPLSGPANWARVDGQDHDLDEMLSLLRPTGAETLAIFAPPQSWKPFYDKIYGREPIDLAFYAVIYSLSLDGSGQPNLSDWSSFYQEATAEFAASDSAAALPPGEAPGLPASEAVTFRTTFAPAGEDSRQGEAVYTVFTSLILTGRRIFFLNLFQIDPGDPDEVERLALAWRAEFLKTPAQLEESHSEQTLE